MADMFTRKKRSQIMGRIRSKGNLTTELRFVRLCRQHKICGWRRSSNLPGRPDFVFYKARVVVFIDGDFWHGNPKRYRIPKTNCNYWQQKIAGNRARDRRVTRTLKSMGWKVIRIWESDLNKERAIVAKLSAFL